MRDLLPECNVITTVERSACTSTCTSTARTGFLHPYSYTYSYTQISSALPSNFAPPTGLVPVEANVELGGCAHPHSTSFTTGIKPVGSAPPHSPRTRAFTLVEIALAMLAFSLGILSFFALLSLGLNQDMEAQDQTRASEFADSTLRGLRAISDHLSETAEGDEWHAFWQDLRDGRTNIIVTAGGDNGIWHPPPVVRSGGHTTRVNAYTNYLLRSDRPSEIVSHVIRYRMDIALVRALETTPRANRAQVTLRVWEGETGRSADPDAMIFYTEFTDRGAVR